MEIFNDSIAVLGFPGSSDSNEGNLRSIPVLEDPLEEGKATHSSLLAWRIPWTEEPDGLLAMGLQRARHDWATNISFQFFIEET